MKQPITEGQPVVYRKRSLWQTILKERWAYYFILPGLVLFLIFNFIPILETLRLSFYDYQLGSQTFTGFDNYIKAFQDERFVKSYINTFKYILTIVPLNVLLSLFIAAVLSTKKAFTQSLYRGAFYLPTVVGGVIISAVWLWMYHPNMGLFNYIVEFFGGEKIAWLSDSRFAFPAVCLVVLTWTVGTSVIIFLAGMLGISPELYESAKIDGANSFQAFIHVTLPLLKPVTVFIVTTQLINTFQVWEAIYMLTNGGPNYGTMSSVYYLYQTAFVSGKYGLASTQGIILTLTILVFSWISMKSSKEL